MLAELDWDTLKLRRQAARLTLLYKVTSDQAAITALKFLTPVARPTRHNNSKAFQRPRAKKDCYKNSFFPRTISEWNVLPETTCKLNNTHQFQAHEQVDWLASLYIIGYRDWHRVIDTMVNIS